MVTFILVVWVCGAVGCSGAPAPAASAATSGRADVQAVAAVQGPERPSTSPVARPPATLDVAPLDAVLRKHVRGGRVDYLALKADAGARAKLEDFLKAVETMPEGEPLASWLNVYNALVIQFVLERYPLVSVMDVKPDFFKALERRVAGTQRSLDAIEHQVIRKRFADARVHVALNCGAVSCPALMARAFRQEDLDADLDALAKAAMADPRHAELVGGKLVVSALFFWFRDDFVRDGGSVVGWIKRHGPGSFAALPGDTPLLQREYDWRLADAAR